MDKTLTLVITAMVLIIAALAVMTLTTNSIGDFKTDKDNLADTGCEFQEEHGDEDDLSPGCETSYELEDEQTVYAT